MTKSHSQETGTVTVDEERAEAIALDDARPLFLIGAPRSGTTILAKLLNGHREVLMTHETAIFLQLDHLINNSRIGSRAGTPFGKSYNELWAGHLHDHAKQLIETFYSRIAAQEKKPRLRYWGEKHPHLNRCLPFLTKLFPDAMYVYAVRDPRDTACSIAKMTGVSRSDALTNWGRFAKVYEDFADATTPERVTVVRYEDLVIDYESAMSNVFNVLGLELDAAASEFLAENKNKPSHNPRAVQRIDYAEKSVGRWQREMSEEERAYAMTIGCRFMLRHGYVESLDSETPDAPEHPALPSDS